MKITKKVSILCFAFSFSNFATYWDQLEKEINDKLNTWNKEFEVSNKENRSNLANISIEECFAKDCKNNNDYEEICSAIQLAINEYQVDLDSITYKKIRLILKDNKEIIKSWPKKKVEQLKNYIAQLYLPSHVKFCLKNRLYDCRQ